MSSPVLVDTSLWVEHFRAANTERADRLTSLAARVRIHEFILGELIIGYIGRSHPAISRLSLIRRLPTRPHDAVVEFVRAHQLEGCGIGWADAHLISAAVHQGAALWTLDRALARTAAKVGIDCI